MREGGNTREQLVLEIRELRERNSLLEAEKLSQSIALSDLERFKTISDSAEHGNIIADFQGNLVYINDYFAGKHGYTAEEVLGKNFSIFHSEEQLKLVEKVIESMTDCGKYGPTEVGHIHRDGSEFTMLTSGIFINDEGGKPAYIAASAIDITERKLAEKALRAERDKLKIIFSSIKDGIYIVDHEYNIEFVNPVLSTNFGPYEGEKCYSYFHGSESSCPSCGLPDVIAGKTVPREWTSPISGKTYSMLDTPLKNADGSVGRLEVLRDITDQKQSEEARILHLKFLENLNRIDAVIRKSTDVEQMMSDVLQATLEIFQSDRAWLLYPCDPDAKSWKVPMERTLPEYPGALALGEDLPMIPEVQTVCRRALKENDVITIDSREECAPKKTDRQFSTLSQIQIVLHPQTGKPWLFGLHQCSHFREWSKEETDLFREISHRLSDALSSLLLVRDLRESRENLNEAQRVARIGSWSLDIVSNVLTWAEETYRIFEMEPQQFSLSLETFLNAVHPDDREFVNNAYTKSVSNRTAYDISHRLLMNDSRIKHVREMCETFYNDQGQPIRSIGTTQDITDIKNAEKKNQELQRQVQHAQKLESLGVLAGGIAHDFNNILMAILGNADLALMDLPKANPAYSNIKAIETAARRAADLAKQMLAYSGKGKFLIEKINLNEAVDEMTHILEVSISKRAVIKYNYSDNLPLIEADATQIRQIIMNLVTNASDAIDRTSGVIAITTGAMDCDSGYLASTYIDEALNAGQYVYVEVSDTGSGMDGNTLKKLFDPFFTTKFTGRGLGLSAVLGIIRGHKGAIKVYSEPGKGTLIKVLFPACNDTFEPVEHRNDGMKKHWTGSGTILLVDDEETILSVGKQMLLRLGFDVLTASDGQVAVEQFRNNSDDIILVILDLIMPRLDGEETFRELRRIRENVRVIMCSGYNEQEVTHRFTGKSLAGFLHKPYMFRQIEAKIKEVLNE